MASLAEGPPPLGHVPANKVAAVAVAVVGGWVGGWGGGLPLGCVTYQAAFGLERTVGSWNGRWGTSSGFCTPSARRKP